MTLGVSAERCKLLVSFGGWPRTLRKAQEWAVPVDSMDGMDDMDMGHGCVQAASGLSSIAHRAAEGAPSAMSIVSTVSAWIMEP